MAEQLVQDQNPFAPKGEATEGLALGREPVHGLAPETAPLADPPHVRMQPPEEEQPTPDSRRSGVPGSAAESRKPSCVDRSAHLAPVLPQAAPSFQRW